MEYHRLSRAERGRLWLRIGIRAVLLLAAGLLIFLAVPPLISLLLPFVLALVLAWILNPPVRWLRRRLPLSRRALSLILLLLLFCVVGGGVTALVWAAVREVRSLFENWDAVTGTVLSTLSGMADWLGRLTGALPEALGLRVETLFDALADWVRGLDVSGWLTSLAGRAPSVVTRAGGTAISLAVFLMASYFITGDYPRLRFLVTDRVPPGAREFCAAVKRVFTEAFGGYIKSQLILTLGVFGILLLGFTVIRQEYGLMLAAALAVLDFVPLVGAGTVMVPWFFLDLALGNFDHALGFGIIWGLVVVFRRVAEPKILGDQTGLSPVLSLAGIYVGMRLGGVAGMVLGPIALLVILNLTRLGIFRPAEQDLRRAARDVRAILREGRET